MDTRAERFKMAVALRDAGHQVKEISGLLQIPLRTIQNWFAVLRKNPDWVPDDRSQKAGLAGAQKCKRIRALSQTPPLVIDMLSDAVAKAESLDAMKAADAAEADKIEQASEERKQKIRSMSRSGDFLQAGAELSDAAPDEWEELGKVFAPEFLRSWQCGRLLFYLASGIHRAISLARVGIRLSEFEIWLTRAGNKVEPFSTFIDLCSMAQASACARLQKLVQKKTPGWQALSWSLERLSPEIFAKHVLDDRALEDSSFADVGDDNIKRTALAFIKADNDRTAADVEFVDLDEIEGRND